MTTVAEIFKSMEYGPAPESDAEARRWLASHREQQFGQFIDGVWTHPGKTFDVIDPSNASVLARVSQGTKSEVDAGIAALDEALGAFEAQL